MNDVSTSLSVIAVETEELAFNESVLWCDLGTWHAGVVVDLVDREGVAVAVVERPSGSGNCLSRVEITKGLHVLPGSLTLGFRRDREIEAV
jgi:hypothetical protein